MGRRSQAISHRGLITSGKRAELEKSKKNSSSWILSFPLFLIGVLITIQQGEAILQEINLYPNWIVNDHKYNYSSPWKQIVLDKWKIHAEDL